MFDSSSVWKGVKQEEAILEFPRQGEEEVPISVKYAVASLTLSIYQHILEQSEGSIQSETIRSMTTMYFKKPLFVEEAKKIADTYCSQLVRRTVKLI